MRKIHLSLILIIGAILWGILLIISGIAVSFDWLRPLTIVSGILLLIIGIFDRWLWRLPICRGWLVKRPNINGTWQVELISSWIDPNIGQPIPPIKGYMTIWQTYSFLNMRLLTVESKSTLIGSEIVSDKDDTYRIAAIYENEPKQMVRNISTIHRGGFLLQCTGLSPTTINGNYWTDRGTKGDIEMRNRHNKIYVDFNEASSAYTK
jgi:hypothetical protein